VEQQSGAKSQGGYGAAFTVIELALIYISFVAWLITIG